MIDDRRHGRIAFMVELLRRLNLGAPASAYRVEIDCSTGDVTVTGMCDAPIVLRGDDPTWEIDEFGRIDRKATRKRKRRSTAPLR